MTYYVTEWAASGDNEVTGEFIKSQELASGEASAVFDDRTFLVIVTHDGAGIGFVRYSKGAGTPAAPEAGFRIPIFPNAQEPQALFNKSTNIRLYDRLAVVDAA